MLRAGLREMHRGCFLHVLLGDPAVAFCYGSWTDLTGLCYALPRLQTKDRTIAALTQQLEELHAAVA